jgi:hypothetical protein
MQCKGVVCWGDGVSVCWPRHLHPPYDLPVDANLRMTRAPYVQAMLEQSCDLQGIE